MVMCHNSCVLQYKTVVVLGTGVLVLILIISATAKFCRLTLTVTFEGEKNRSCPINKVLCDILSLQN